MSEAFYLEGEMHQVPWTFTGPLGGKLASSINSTRESKGHIDRCLPYELLHGLKPVIGSS